jgi:hypothetical protein
MDSPHRNFFTPPNGFPVFWLALRFSVIPLHYKNKPQKPTLPTKMAFAVVYHYRDFPMVFHPRTSLLGFSYVLLLSYYSGLRADGHREGRRFFDILFPVSDVSIFSRYPKSRGGGRGKEPVEQVAQTACAFLSLTNTRAAQAYQDTNETTSGPMYAGPIRTSRKDKSLDSMDLIYFLCLDLESSLYYCWSFIERMRERFVIGSVRGRLLFGPEDGGR